MLIFLTLTFWEMFERLRMDCMSEEHRRGIPLPIRLGWLEERRKFPSGVRAEPRLKTELKPPDLVIWSLVLRLTIIVTQTLTSCSQQHALFSLACNLLYSGHLNITKMDPRYFGEYAFWEQNYPLKMPGINTASNVGDADVRACRMTTRRRMTALK